MAKEESTFKNIMEIYQSYISIYPEYFKEFSELISNVIYKDNDNSFSLQYKLYYGIIASSSIGSNLLIEDFKNKFILYGGDTSWVEQGINSENIPKHIKGFAKMSDILVHRPWILHWAHFSEFDNGLTFFLFQSAIILTTIHRFATIISALNIFVKNDIENNKIKLDKKINGVNISELIENKENKKFKEKYILNPIEYVNFNQHNDTYLYVDDFEWKTNAKYFFSDYAEKEMDFLEKELKSLDSIPYDKNDEKNIFSKKNAIEKYVGIILGINDREYDYHNTNIILTIDLKTLIKKIVCFPEKLHEENLGEILIRLDKDNLIRLIFFVTAIKQKICLTFFAKAFDDFSSNKKKTNYIKTNNSEDYLENI